MTDNNEDIHAVLLRGTTGVFFVRLFGALLMFITHIILARILGVTDYGIFAYILAWIVILNQSAMLGFDISLIRYVASYMAHQKFSEVRGIIITGLVSVLLSSLALAFIVVFINSMIRSPLEYEELRTLLFGLILLVFMAINSIRQSIMRGLKYVIRSILPDQIIRPSLFITICVVCYIYEFELHAKDAMFIYAASAFIIMVLGLKWLHALLPSEVKSSTPSYHIGEWIQTSLPLFMVSAMTFVLSQTDLIMLGMLSDKESTGIYSAVARLSEIVVFGLIAINSIAAPLIAEQYSKDNMKELQKLLSGAAQLGSIYTVFACVGLYYFGRDLLGLFGDDFLSGYAALLFLLAGYMVSAFAGSVGNILTMTGEQVIMGKILGFIAILNIVLNYILIPIYGLNGAAIATASSVALWNIIMLTAVMKKLGINPTVFRFIRLDLK